VSGIAPPRAPADALPAFAHVSEKIDTRQDLKWCGVIFNPPPHDIARMSAGASGTSVPWRQKKHHPLQLSAGGLRCWLSRGNTRFALDRFEILNEPSGTYSIFDTELSAMVAGRTFIGRYRYQAPLALLAAMEADGKPWAPPSLSSLSNCQTNNTYPTHQNGLQT
jgi:hypothetical protein